MRLVVLGGSSPFAVSLIDALEVHGSFSHSDSLVLFGRNEDNLRLMGAYAEHHLSASEWKIITSLDITTALRGADFVLHQIRYGDLAGRASDEAFAQRWHTHADESLGPAGFRSVIRALPTLRKFSEIIAEMCPKAWVLNLTNPVSLVTALMIEAGVDQCIGLCELPVVTAYHIAKNLGLPLNDVQWSYVGLNHRGFIVRMEYRGRDLIKECLDRLDSETMADVPTAIRDSLRAIPLKYFQLFLENSIETRISRAKFLIELRKNISKELRNDIAQPPPSLKKRPEEWYSKAVVPMLISLSSEKPRLQVVNCLSPEGLVEEFQAMVSRTSIRVITPPKINNFIENWLRIFRALESAQLHALRNPSLGNFIEVASIDPFIPQIHVEAIAQELWMTYRKHQGFGQSRG